LINEKNITIIFGNSLENRLPNFEILKKVLVRANSTVSFLKININPNTEGSNLLNIAPLSTEDIENASDIFTFNLEDTIALRKYLINRSIVYWLSPYALNWSKSKDFLFYLPTNSSYEENGTFINLERRPQKSFRILNSFSLTLPKILVPIFTKRSSRPNLNKPHNYLLYLFEIIKHQKKFDHMDQTFMNFIDFIKEIQTTSNSFYPIKSSIEDFYSSNLNSKNSFIMSQCSRDVRKTSTNF